MIMSIVLPEKKQGSAIPWRVLSAKEEQAWPSRQEDSALARAPGQAGGKSNMATSMFG